MANDSPSPATGGSRPSSLGLAWQAALHWSPVWIPLVLLAQILILGLRPALARGSELDILTPQVSERCETTDAEHAFLERQVRAWDDPIFRARNRRALDRGLDR